MSRDSHGELFYSRPRRQHLDCRAGRVSNLEARLTAGSRHPLGKPLQELNKHHKGKQWPQWVHDRERGTFGSRPDGSRVSGYEGRDIEDIFHTSRRRDQKGVTCKEAGFLVHKASRELAEEWGTQPHPGIDTDPGFLMAYCRFFISGGRQEEVRESQCSLDDDTLTLWANSPQDTRSFQHAIFTCLYEPNGGPTGLSVVNDMPGSGFEEKQAMLMAKWLTNLLAMPDFWPSTTGRAAHAHAPRLRRLRAIFLVQSKWTEARYLIQPVMAAHEDAFSELTDSPRHFASDERRLSPSTGNGVDASDDSARMFASCFDASGDGAHMRMCDV